MGTAILVFTSTKLKNELIILYYFLISRLILQEAFYPIISQFCELSIIGINKFNKSTGLMCKYQII